MLLSNMITFTDARSKRSTAKRSLGTRPTRSDSVRDLLTMINQHGARERRGLTAQEWYFVPRVCSSRRAQHQCDRCHLEFVRHDVFFVDAAKSTLEVCGDVSVRGQGQRRRFCCVWHVPYAGRGFCDSLAVCWNTASPRSMFFA